MIDSDANRQSSALYCGSVGIVNCKKPSDSLLCVSDFEDLSIGEQLKVMRLRSEFTIKDAAELAGIDRCTLMNYEWGRTKRIK